MRVAVIDDDGLMAEVAAKHLRRAGHDPQCFIDSRQGVQAVESGRFDVLVTDVVMPEMDGIEVIRRLRKTHPGLHIVAMSGGSNRLPSDMMLTISSALGADQVLYKPFLREDFIAAVEGRPRPTART